MKRLIFLITLFVLSTYGNAQDVNIFNGYKYIHLPPLVYQNGRVDIYGISAVARGYFIEKGFGIVTDISDQSKVLKEIKDNPCIVLTCNIEHPAPNLMSNTVTFSFYNCSNQLVYKTKGSGSMGMDIAGDYRIATKKALREFIRELRNEHVEGHRTATTDKAHRTKRCKMTSLRFAFRSAKPSGQ